MRVKEAAARLDVSASTVYAMIAAGKLKCCRVGLKRGVIRITEDHLAAFLSASEPDPPPAPIPPRPGRRPLRFLRLD